MADHVITIYSYSQNDEENIDLWNFCNRLLDSDFQGRRVRRIEFRRESLRQILQRTRRGDLSRNRLLGTLRGLFDRSESVHFEAGQRLIFIVSASSISNISLVRGNYNPTNQIPLMGKKGRSKKHSKEPNNNIDQVSDNLTRYGAIKVEVPDNWTPPSVARKPTPLVMRSSRLPVKTPSSEQVSQSTGSPVYRPIRQCGSRIPRLQLNTQSTCSKTPPTDSSPSNSQFDSTASVSNQTEKRFAVRRLNFSECTDPAAQGEEDSRLPVYVVEGLDDGSSTTESTPRSVTGSATTFVKMITDERNSMASVPPLDYISAPSEYSPFKKDTATPESIGREAEIKAMRQHA